MFRSHITKTRSPRRCPFQNASCLRDFVMNGVVTTRRRLRENCLVKNQLLHAPVRGFGRVHLALGWARQLMHAGKLLELAARSSDDAEHASIQSHFEQPAGERALAD